jgi:hypothetical protein
MAQEFTQGQAVDRRSLQLAHAANLSQSRQLYRAL